DILSRQLLLDLPPEGFEAGPEVGGVGADHHVEKELVAAYLPDKEAVFPSGLAIEEDFFRSDGAGLGEIAEPDGDAFDSGGAVDDERFAHRQHQLARRLGSWLCTNRHQEESRQPNACGQWSPA